MTKCYGARPADVFSGRLRGDQDNRLLYWCPAGEPHGAGNVLSGVLRSGLKCFREELEGEGVKTFAYVHDVSAGLLEVTTTVSLYLPPTRARR